jgi:DNA-binding response OmpR family regulator
MDPNSPHTDNSVKSSNKRIILWIEDDLVIGTILGNKLIAAGYDLIHVNNGEEALYQLKQVIPSLIVLDILLPGVDGFAILRHIHEDTKLSKIPVIILSNVSIQADVDLAASLGAKKFLTKPQTSLEEVIAAVKALC